MKPTPLLCTWVFASVLGALACNRNEPDPEPEQPAPQLNDWGDSGAGETSGVTCSVASGSGENYVCYYTCGDGSKSHVYADVESSEKCADITKVICRGEGGLVSCRYAPAE